MEQGWGRASPPAASQRDRVGGRRRRGERGQEGSKKETAGKKEKDREADGLRDGGGGRGGRERQTVHPLVVGEGMCTQILYGLRGKGPSALLFRPRAGKSRPSLLSEVTCWPGSWSVIGTNPEQQPPQGCRAGV